MSGVSGISHKIERYPISAVPFSSAKGSCRFLVAHFKVADNNLLLARVVTCWLVLATANRKAGTAATGHEFCLGV